MTAFSEGRDDTNERPAPGSPGKTPRRVRPRSLASGRSSRSTSPGRGRGTSFARPLTQRLRGRLCALMCRGGVCASRFSPRGEALGSVIDRRLRSPAGLGPAARPLPAPAPREGSQLASAPTPPPPCLPSRPPQGGGVLPRARGERRTERSATAGRRGPRPGARPATGSRAGCALGEAERASAGSRGRRGQRGAAAAGRGKEAAGLRGTRRVGVSGPFRGSPVPGGRTGGCATRERGPPSTGAAAKAVEEEGRGRPVAPPGGGVGGVAAKSPPPPAAAIGGGRGAGAGAAIGARPPVTEGLAGGDVARRSELTY